MYQLLIFCPFLSLYASVRSSYFKMEFDEGQVANHSRPISIFSAPNSGFCATQCDALGKSNCMSFNVKAGNSGLFCELFSGRSHDLSDGVKYNSRNGKYFERTCDRLSLKAGVKDEVDGQAVFTLIDVEQNVYQKQANAELSYLGHVSEVFSGFHKTVTDITSTTIIPLGWVHLVISGEMLYCYFAEVGLKKFSKCKDAPFFPVKLSSLIDNYVNCIYTISYKTYRQVDVVVTGRNESYLIIATNSEDSLQSTDISIKLAELRLETYMCSNSSWRDPYNLCSWSEVWQMASGGMFMSRDRLCFFVQGNCYIFDFNRRAMIGRYSTCKDEITHFLQ